MAISVSNGSPEAPRPSAETTSAPERAPSGRADYWDMYDSVGIRSISPEIEPYLNRVREMVQANLTNVTVRQVDQSPNTWIFHRNDPQGEAVVYMVDFLTHADLSGPEGDPASRRLSPLRKLVKRMFGEQPNRLIQAVQLMTSYDPDMRKSDIEARSIVATLNVETNPKFINARLTDLFGPEFHIDYSLERARDEVAKYSPHGVVPRMSSAITLTAIPPRDRDRGRGRDRDRYEDDSYGQNRRLPFVTIGGFIEVGQFVPNDRDPDNGKGKYDLRYNVTAIAAPIPLFGVAMVGMGILGTKVFQDMFWLREFSNFGKDAPNIGMVEIDPDDKNELFRVRDERELATFVRRWFNTPEIVLNTQWGHEMVPGMWRLTDARGGDDTSVSIMEDLGDFFDHGVPKDVDNLDISEMLGTRIDGYFGHRDGRLLDSRDIDFFTVAEQEGVASYDSLRREIMTTVSRDELWTRDQQKTVAGLTQNFVPMYETSLSAINPEYLGWINRQADKCDIDVVDTESRRTYVGGRSRTSRFGDPSDVGSMVNASQGPTFKASRLFDN